MALDSKNFVVASFATSVSRKTLSFHQDQFTIWHSFQYNITRSSSLSMVRRSQWVLARCWQLYHPGANTILFVMGIRLLWRRNRRHVLTFHIASTIILFMLATIVAVTLPLQTSAMMGEWDKINVIGCRWLGYISHSLFIAEQCLSCMESIILYVATELISYEYLWTTQYSSWLTDSSLIALSILVSLAIYV